MFVFWTDIGDFIMENRKEYAVSKASAGGAFTLLLKLFGLFCLLLFSWMCPFRLLRVL